MNKKLLFRCLLAITLSLSSICLANTKGSFDFVSSHRYHNSEFNFSLQIPKRWYNKTLTWIKETNAINNSNLLLPVFDDITNKKTLLFLNHQAPQIPNWSTVHIFATSSHWYLENSSAKDAALVLRAVLINKNNILKKYNLTVLSYSQVHSMLINGQQFTSLDFQLIADKQKLYISDLFTKRAKHIIEIRNIATSTKLLQQALKLGHTIQFLPVKTT